MGARRLGLIAAVGVVVLASVAPARAADDKGGQLSQVLAVAEAQRRDGVLDAAAKLYRHALGIAVGGFGGDSPQAVAVLTALAQVDLDRGRYLDAEGLLVVAHTDIAGAGTAVPAIFAGLARVASARGDNAGAETWGRRAVASAGDKPTDAEPLRALGAALTAEGKFAEAQTMLDKALALDRSLHGDDATETARSLSQLANLYQRQDMPARALPLIEQAAEIDQRRLGPPHPLIADDFYDLGVAYEALKRDADARAAFAFAVRVLNRGAGRDTPRVAYAETQLSAIDRREGKNAAADAEFRDAKRILDAADDADSDRKI